MLLLHFDRTRAVFSRNHESSEIVIGLWSSKLRMEWRSCRSLANGEIAFDWKTQRCAFPFELCRKARTRPAGEGVRLVILDSPYRLFIEPLLAYIEELDNTRMPNEIITVVVPQFVSSSTATAALHSRTAETLRKVLLNRTAVVVTEVPYKVD